MQEVHRSYIVNKENRIKWLESIIRDRCADVDLDHGQEQCQEALNEGESMQTETLDGVAENRAHHEDQSLADHVLERRHAAENSQSSRIIISQDQEISRANEEPQQAHEIGLLSLSPGGDPRYIGPSSGFFFVKRILNRAGCRVPRASTLATSPSAQLCFELLNSPAALPAQRQCAVELTARYFQTVHILYPFLHEQMHMEAVDRVYASQETNPLETFQVYMVLAIASLNLSRQCKVHLPVEGYYASAMQQMDYVCSHGSVTSLQCLLLLMVYALYNPSCNINIWSLNYQCLASVIDLGLQRDVQASPSLHISVFDQQMRARIFWTVYTFDRTVCTMMGRPIGLRDEAFDTRLPLAFSDRDLIDIDRGRQRSGSLTSHITYSIHLFSLAQMNSEIKYVMHSIKRDAPRYALPAIRDIITWQQDMMKSLRSWRVLIPQPPNELGTEIVLLCKAKYHETMILLLRPSPGIPDPSDEILDECFNHALMLLREYSELYTSGNLLYNRLVVHSIFLGTLVMLNCIWKLPSTAARVPVDDLISKFNTSQNILSSIGEHWSEASRARDCIRELSTVTIQRLLKTQPTPGPIQTSQANVQYQIGDTQRLEPSLPQQYPVDGSNEDPANVSTDPYGEPQAQAGFDPSASEFSNLFDDFLQGDFPGWSGMSDIDGFMWEIFNSAAQ
ncbi:Zn(II)2Cys6 transcription factor [Aspergillus undulatus]|uniref:Zn(II)2Cys6 transcription factor n=1 Tax=Aspergillus undulatus TaxID=1810928 RepID=UPI003CCD677A